MNGEVRGLTAFRYRLLDESGADLGPLASQRRDWSPGDRVARWHGEALVVLSVVEADEGDNVHGYLVVRPT